MAGVKGKGRILLSGGVIAFASEKRRYSPQLVRSKTQLRDASGRFEETEERKPLLAQLLERSGVQKPQQRQAGQKRKGGAS